MGYLRNISLLILFIFAVSIETVSADPWDCMTESQANELMTFLKKNPFVVDYCDCCDAVARKYDNRKIFGHLIKIEKMEIVRCSWDESQFSVNILESTILLSGIIENNKFITAKADYTDLELYNQSWPITLNYTWTYKAGKSSRLFENIPYNADDVNCSGLKKFPSPSEVPAAKLQKAYKKFIKRK
jgi:hypothetical protein